MPLDTILLERNLNKTTGNVTAAMMATTRITSSLRDGCGTPTQTSSWKRVVKSAELSGVDRNEGDKHTGLLDDVALSHNTKTKVFLQGSTCAKTIRKVCQLAFCWLQHSQTALMLAKMSEILPR